MNEMNEPRTEGFERLKGRLFSYLVKRSVSEPAEGLEGIATQGLTVAFERFLHEVALCLVQSGALVSAGGVMVEQECKGESIAAVAGSPVVPGAGVMFAGGVENV